MASIKDVLQTADWKSEKHVPVIEVQGVPKKAEQVKVAVSVGKEIAHPNTTEHHIIWIEVYFLPRQEKFPYQLGRFEFGSHGASTQGPNTSGVYTQPQVLFSLKTDKAGTIFAAAYCNIHGIWENSQELNLE